MKFSDIASLDRQEETQTLSVQFYYTDEFADVTSDPVAYIQGLVDSANTVYSKSNVPLQMYARCFTRLSSVKESDNAIDTLTAFRNSKCKKRGRNDITVDIFEVARQTFDKHPKRVMFRVVQQYFIPEMRYSAV